MEKDTQSQTSSWLSVIAGVWLIVAPFILGYSNPAAQTNDIWLGIIVGVVALIRAFSPGGTAWLSMVNVLAGLWLIVSPFVLGYTAGEISMWNDIILGVVVLASSVWNGGALLTMNQGQPRHA